MSRGAVGSPSCDASKSRNRVDQRADQSWGVGSLSLRTGWARLRGVSLGHLPISQGPELIDRGPAVLSGSRGTTGRSLQTGEGSPCGRTGLSPLCAAGPCGPRLGSARRPTRSSSMRRSRWSGRVGSPSSDGPLRAPNEARCPKAFERGMEERRPGAGYSTRASSTTTTARTSRTATATATPARRRVVASCSWCRRRSALCSSARTAASARATRAAAAADGVG